MEYILSDSPDINIVPGNSIDGSLSPRLEFHMGQSARYLDPDREDPISDVFSMFE